MLYYRTLELNQIEDFWKLLNTLDAETDYMMYEPNERTQTTNVQELKNDIENNVICGSDFLQVAMENQKMVGYIRAERGKFNRILHTAYIVVGILKDYRGKGIGTSFFEGAALPFRRDRPCRFQSKSGARSAWCWPVLNRRGRRSCKTFRVHILSEKWHKKSRKPLKNFLLGGPIISG